jgi:AsmA protein
MANARRMRPRGGGDSNRWLVIAGYAGLGVGCLLLAAATFIVLAAPLDGVRDRIVREVKARTGRDLVVSGGTSLVLFPRPAIAFANVSLSPPRGMGGAPTLKVDALEAQVSLLSLFTSQPSIRRLVLTRPVLELRVDAQGRRSWDFAAGPRPVRAAQVAFGGDAHAQLAQLVQQGRRPASGEQLAAALERLAPSRVSILDGTLHYVDERNGARYEVKSADLDLALERADGPLEAKGSLALQGEKVAVEAALGPMRALLQEQKARLALKLAGRAIEAGYDGTLSVASGPALDGMLSLRASSLETLAAWLGRPMTGGQETGTLSLSSPLSVGNGQASLSRLTATLGDVSLDGALKIETKGARPRLTGNLRVSELDFGRMLVRPGAAAPAPATPPTGKRLSDPIDDILRGKEAPARGQVRGFTKRAGGGSDWSDDIIDFAPLGLADADLALTADRATHKDLKIGPTRLSLKLDNKVAKVTLEDMQLYGGRGRGNLTLDGSGQVPVTAANLTLEGVSAGPLLKEAMGFDWLEGQSTITLSLAGQGVSERQMVEALNGKVDVATTNGAIVGFDVDKVLRSIEQGRLPNLGLSAGEKTPFSEFAGSYTITNGVAQNNDLRLVSQRLRVTGQGSVNLAQRQLDYTVNPKIAGGVAVPGAVINVKNLDIPVRIHGPWDKPSFSLKGQQQIIDAVKEIGKNIKPKDVDDALKGLFGGSDGQTPKPRDLIEKFLKKQ